MFILLACKCCSGDFAFFVGFEAPRNSLELPTEVSQINHVIHENIPVSCLIMKSEKETYDFLRF